MISLPPDVTENLTALGIEPVAVRMSCGCELVRWLRGEWRWQERCADHGVQHFGVAPGTLCTRA